MLIMYMQFLDKTLINYSSIFGLKQALHLHGSQYSWLGRLVVSAPCLLRKANNSKHLLHRLYDRLDRLGQACSQMAATYGEAHYRSCVGVVKHSVTYT